MSYSLELFIPTDDGYRQTTAVFDSLEAALHAAQEDLAEAENGSALRRFLSLLDRRKPYFRLYDMNRLTSANE